MGRKEISTNRDGREFPFAVLQPLAQLLKDQRDRTSELEYKQGRIIPHVFHRNGRPIRSYVARLDGRATLQDSMADWSTT
jgi:hypothetical protein